MSDRKYYEKRPGLYIRDIPKYNKLRNEFKKLYYQRYGVSLTVGDALLIALAIGKSALLKNDFILVEEKECSLKIEEIYGRIF